MRMVQSGAPQEKRPLGCSWLKWKYEVRKDVQLVVPNEDWHDLAIDRGKWHDICLNMILIVEYKEERENRQNKIPTFV